MSVQTSNIIDAVLCFVSIRPLYRYAFMRPDSFQARAQNIINILIYTIMKKNIRDYKVNGKQFAYVLDAICVYDYEGTELEATDKECVKYFFDCFESEFNFEYNRRRYPNLQNRINEYLKGLPSCIRIAFENYKIAEIGKSWGYCKNERKEAQFIENWFSVIAFRLIQLKRYFEL